MNFSRTNIVLALLLLVVALLAAAIKVDHSQPNLEFLPEMKRSPASGTYEASGVFANGRTLQPPPAGTIARGDLPLDYAPTKEDALRAGEELQNPYAGLTSTVSVEADGPAQHVDEEQTADAGPTEQSAGSNSGPTEDDVRAQRLQASILRGGEIYNISCVACHGPGGAGDGPVARRSFPPPPPLTTGKSVEMQDGQLFHILTYGQGSMASMAAQLSRDRRWDVINYVRKLQRDAPAVAPPGAGSPTTTPDAAAVPTPEQPWPAGEGQP